MFRVLNGIMLAVFLLSMVVQYNDGDQWLWMGYYGVAAAFTGMALAKRYTVWTAVAAAGYLIGVAYYIPGWNWETVMLLREPKMTSDAVELAREAFGLLICAVWMIVLSVAWYRRRERTGNAPADPDVAR